MGASYPRSPPVPKDLAKGEEGKQEEMGEEELAEGEAAEEEEEEEEGGEEEEGRLETTPTQRWAYGTTPPRPTAWTTACMKA